MNLTIRKKKICKDVDKLPQFVREQAAQQIETLQAAATLSDVSNVSHLQGTHEPYYRLKFGDYRMMLYYYQDTNTVMLLSITHRKDTYKKHNLPWK
jgi:mRNA-degrading endonuclease RelE of RelBE toxin-antitoxin system